jgi:hypothetical protein
MDIIQTIETLGIPVAVACVLGYAALYLMKFITGQLMQQLNQQFQRLEDIVIKLIDSNNKDKSAIMKHSADSLARFDTLITVFKKLTGNGLKK